MNILQINEQKQTNKGKLKKMEKVKLTCPICGEPTNVYMGNARKDRLCKKHGKMANAGEIIQCPDCGKWNEKDIVCECKTPKTIFNNIVPEQKNNVIESNNDFTEQKENKCLICENDSGKYLFCKKCYNKYHGKTLLLKITCDQNQKLELLNESYEGVFTCKDGHIVKSKSEREIDNYLFEHKIAHAYEKSLPIGTEIFKPDFYLKDMDIYIEHWGYNSDNEEYTKRKEYKLPKYKEKGITLIQTNEKDMQDPETSLEIKLNNYKKGEINPE